MDFSALEKSIGYTFKDKDKLKKNLQNKNAIAGQNIRPHSFSPK